MKAKNKVDALGQLKNREMKSSWPINFNDIDKIKNLKLSIELLKTTKKINQMIFDRINEKDFLLKCLSLFKSNSSFKSLKLTLKMDENSSDLQKTMGELTSVSFPLRKRLVYSIPLTHNNQYFGNLSFSLANEKIHTDEIKFLLVQMCKTISLALWMMRSERIRILRTHGNSSIIQRSI